VVIRRADHRTDQGHDLPAGTETLTAEVRQLRRNLETRSTYAYLEQAEELYGWPIKPIHRLLTEQRMQRLQPRTAGRRS